MQADESHIIEAIQSLEDEIKDLTIYYDYVRNSVPTGEYWMKMEVDPRKSILDSISSHLKEKKSVLGYMMSILPKNIVD